MEVESLRSTLHFALHLGNQSVDILLQNALLGSLCTVTAQPLGGHRATSANLAKDGVNAISYVLKMALGVRPIRCVAASISAALAASLAFGSIAYRKQTIRLRTTLLGATWRNIILEIKLDLLCATVDALAYNLAGFDGIICPVMNARRNQVYNALFEWNGEKTVRLCTDRALSIDELDEELVKLGKKVYLSGDGYDITERGFKNTVVEYVPEKMRHQSGYSVACCALEKIKNGNVLSDAELVPIYLRPSQAERERNERLGLN